MNKEDNENHETRTEMDQKPLGLIRAPLHEKKAGLFSSFIGSFEVYSFPTVRSDWGEVQSHFATEWSDLFLDLVYVGAAYKLGTVLAYADTPSEHDPTDKHAFVMFAALFFIFYHSWQSLNDFKSRFMNDDVIHHLLEVVQTGNLAFGVSHIQSTFQLRNMQNYHMFWISSVIVMDKIIALSRFIETYCVAFRMASEKYTEDSWENPTSMNVAPNGRKNSVGISRCISFFTSIFTGNRIVKPNWNTTVNNKVRDLTLRIKSTSMRAMLGLSLQLFFAILATVVSVVSARQQNSNTNGGDDDDDEATTSYYYSFRRRIAASSYAYSSSYSYGANDGDDHVTFTVSAPNLVVSLWICAAFVNIVNNLVIFLGKLTRSRQSVPIHLMYMLHRHGEYVMLLIGESIFSMLMSPTIYASNTKDQLKTYFTCAMPLIFRQCLYRKMKLKLLSCLLKQMPVPLLWRCYLNFLLSHMTRGILHRVR